MLLQQKNRESLRLSLHKNILQVNYKAKTERCLYDVCDVFGKIYRTGNLPTCGKIALRGLYEGNYVLVVLDGDQVTSKRFVLRNN